MSRQPFLPRPRLSAEGAFPPPGPAPQAPGRAGPVPSLFSPLSRRQFLRTTAGAGLVLGAGLLLPRRPLAAGTDNLLPNPIPFSQKLQGYGPFHFMFPGPADHGHEPSLITDLNGFIGVAMFSGTGTDGDGHALTFSGDMRFMKGEYIDVSRKHHQGAFAFI